MDDKLTLIAEAVAENVVGLIVLVNGLLNPIVKEVHGILDLEHQLLKIFLNEVSAVFLPIRIESILPLIS
jgi:hypothetical protein